MVLKGCINIPIERTQNLHNALFSASVPTERNLYRERYLRVVAGVDGKPTAAIAQRTEVLDMGTKPRDLCETRIAVFVLHKSQIRLL